MLRVTLSQLKAHSRRFIAVGLAVMLAVAFLLSTLLVSSSTTASLTASLGASYQRADLLARPALRGSAFDASAVQSARDVPGVAEVYGQRSQPTTAQSGSAAFMVMLENTAPESLETAQLDSGHLPSSDKEVALDTSTAADNRLRLGSTLTLPPDSSVDSEGNFAPGKDVSVTVTGLLKPSNDPLKGSLGQMLGTTELLKELSPSTENVSVIQITAAPGTELGPLRSALETALTSSTTAGPEGQGAIVQTPEQAAMEMVKASSGGQDVLTGILLSFAVIAVFVSALVVSNTFSVIVAQRSRELALLRCIGAAKGQVRNAVLVEAFLVGLLASVLGIAVGIGVMAGLIAWAKTEPSRSFATLAVEPGAVIGALLVGVIMTLIAALIPARAATRVAPLAALRPSEDAAVNNRRGKIRLIIGLIFMALGLPLLIGGAVAAQLFIALPGGLLTFVGLLMCGTLFIPLAVSLVGRLLKGTGVPARLAALNAVRNPARTAATANALLIGVTLVVMMMVGAGSAKASFNTDLDARYPVDAVATASFTGMGDAVSESFSLASVRAVEGVDGVTSAALLRSAGTLAQFKEVGSSQNEDRAGSSEGYPDVYPEVYAMDPADAAKVIKRSPQALGKGVVLLPREYLAGPVTVKGKTGTIVLEGVPTQSQFMYPVISTEDAETINAGNFPAQGPQIWLSVDDAIQGDQARTVFNNVATALDIPQAQVTGAALERLMFEEVINVLLLVVTALLAVAVFIALIGVANTLSLSVLERTRENSLLRALGLTRSQLRWMLALEAVLIAGVAALLGIIFGGVFGWLGAVSALSGFSPVPFDAPWLAIAGVLLVAVLAALAASVLPARRASRLSPVEGLATA